MIFVTNGVPYARGGEPGDEASIYVHTLIQKLYVGPMVRYRNSGRSA